MFNSAILQRIVILFFVMLFAMTGCNGAAVETSTNPTIDAECQDPRPELCTQEYDPVCTLRDTGNRCVTTPCPSTEWKTYGNACRACNDTDVMGYRMGECRDQTDSP